MAEAPEAAGRCAEARFLFITRAGSGGLGHLARDRLLARLLGMRLPGARFAFAVRGESAETLAGLEGEVLALPDFDRASVRRIRDLIGAFKPHVVVNDVTRKWWLCAYARARGARVAVMIQATGRFEEQAKYLTAAWARVTDLPVMVDDWGAGEVPADAAATPAGGRILRIGPLARRPDPVMAEEVRARYGGAGRLVVLSSGGGGEMARGRFPGYGPLFVEAAGALAPDFPDDRFVVVVGPHAPKELVDARPRGNLRVVRFEPGLLELIACADLVVATCGANLYGEIMSVGTPALFVPARRSSDSQRLRAQHAEQRGAARALVTEDSSRVAGEVRRLLGDAQALASLRREAGAFVLGNERLVEALADLLERPAPGGPIQRFLTWWH